MSQPAAAQLTPSLATPAIPLAKIAPWALFFGLLGALVIFFAGAGGGAMMHELVHDARHLLAFPCH